MTTHFGKACIAVAALGALSLTGCINLDPAPDPTRFYTIDAPSSPAAPEPERRDLLLIGSISLAGYADQSSLVERRGGHEIVPLTLHRWAEPLSQALPRSISARLETALPGSVVTRSPRSSSDGEAVYLQLSVDRFELTGNNEAVVAISWRLTTSAAAGEAGRAASTVAKKTFESGPDRAANGVKALSRALDEAVGTLAAAIAER
ncbi:MAG TPA: hypothetical protein DCY13_14510 [Verrucomicrobiales bacterium]|nr:hypothetical protein [Verrucomicrobiales bacterium]